MIRHGQTGHNHRGIVQGRFVNSKLSKKGHKQAAAFFEAYQHVPFQKVYTSTLQRTVQTVRPFLDRGIQHEALPGLDEICWGAAEGLFAKSEDNKQYIDIINTWKSGELHPRLEGGENPLDVQERQKEALDYIASQPEDLVLLCMHGRALKIMLAWITGLHIKEMDQFDHDNLSLYILDYQDKKWTIETHDDRAHLKKANLK
ncbi:MAG: histidine phosphatase family protein [Cyclobacteriaceae bacterium]|nr:histidine phosphatase family protein [Cyclobacteriaceae bacterium]